MKMKRSTVIAKRFATDNITLVPEVVTLSLHIMLSAPFTSPPKIIEDFKIHVGKNVQQTSMSLTAKFTTKYVVGVFLWFIKMLYTTTPTLPRIPSTRHTELAMITPMVDSEDG